MRHTDMRGIRNRVDRLAAVHMPNRLHPEDLVAMLRRRFTRREAEEPYSTLTREQQMAHAKELRYRLGVLRESDPWK
jgi:hypothetical protein